MGGRNSRAVGINDNGAVVGWSETPRGAVRAFKWTAAGGMRALPTLAHRECRASHINRLGQVAGYCLNAGGRQRAVLWSPSGQIRDIGTLPGGSTAVATDVNQYGVVVGYSTVAVGSGLELHAFRWTPGRRMVDLGILDPEAGEGGSSEAYRINNARQVVGLSFPGTGTNEVAVLWSPSGEIRGVSPSADYSHAWGINNRGHVVGDGQLEDDSQPYPCCYQLGFRWTPQGGAQLLRPLAGVDGSAAHAINDHELVVGESRHAVVWTAANVAQDLGTLPGGVYSAATDINNHNQAVGFSATSTGATHAVLWTLR